MSGPFLLGDATNRKEVVQPAKRNRLICVNNLPSG